MQKDRGKLTAKACFSMTEELSKKLRQHAFDTGKSLSVIAREALEMYFDFCDERSMPKK